MKNARFLNFMTIFFVGMMLSSCILHYKDITHEEPVKLTKDNVDKIGFKVQKLPFFASDSSVKAVRDAFNNSKDSISVKEYFGEEVPTSGVFVSVEPLYKTPDMPAVAFGYISFTTLTILPVWSNHDGFTITYNVFKDGKLIKTAQYEKERFLAVWLPLVAFSWTNLFTTSEYDAFYSSTNEFLTDFGSILKESDTK